MSAAVSLPRHAMTQLPSFTPLVGGDGGRKNKLGQTLFESLCLVVKQLMGFVCFDERSQGCRRWVETEVTQYVKAKQQIFLLYIRRSKQILYKNILDVSF